jgi:hypothetical protein
MADTSTQSQSFDVNKIIADAQAARAAADAQKAAADKAAQAIKLAKAADRKLKLQVDNKLNYANALSSSIQEMEGQLTVYATKFGRDGKADPIDLKDFNRIKASYDKANAAYNKTVTEANLILAKASTPTQVQTNAGKAEVVAGAKTPLAPIDTTSQANVDNINKQLDQQIKDARKTLLAMSGPDRKTLAKTLTDAGFAVVPTEQFQDNLLLQYQNAINLAKSQNTNNKGLIDPVNLTQFLANKTVLNNELKAAQGGTAGTGQKPTASISSKTEAETYINDVFKSVLNREPTAQEIGTLTQQLNAAERDPRNAVRATTNKNGVVEYTGGIKPVQYISDLIKKLPEFATKQSQAQDLTTKSIQSTALANGLKLSPDQLKSYSDRVKNGEDIKTIESQIRTTAGLGQPDNIKKMLADGSDLNTIYDPYRRVMATSLGLAPDSITLDDPTLRMAIGPDKEMSLYDYQKAIRKDSRWKNSQEANDEVTNMINQVKRDFGFMG